MIAQRRDGSVVSTFRVSPSISNSNLLSIESVATTSSCENKKKTVLNLKATCYPCLSHSNMPFTKHSFFTPFRIAITKPVNKLEQLTHGSPVNTSWPECSHVRPVSHLSTGGLKNPLRWFVSTAYVHRERPPLISLISRTFLLLAFLDSEVRLLSPSSPNTTFHMEGSLLRASQ